MDTSHLTFCHSLSLTLPFFSSGPEPPRTVPVSFYQNKWFGYWKFEIQTLGSPIHLNKEDVPERIPFRHSPDSGYGGWSKTTSYTVRWRVKSHLYVRYLLSTLPCLDYCPSLHLPFVYESFFFFFFRILTFHSDLYYWLLTHRYS